MSNRMNANKPDWTVICFDSIGSTNDHLIEHSHEYLDRTVITADTQTSGKGRNGKSWTSPRGGLYASILLKPAPPAAMSMRVSLLIADTIRELLGRSGIDAKIKWPNDVLVDDRKIAGILSNYTSKPIRQLVIGIGVNLGVSPRFAEKGLPSACWKEFGVLPRPIELLDDILKEMDKRWQDRNLNPLESITRAEEHFWKLGQKLTVRMGDEILEGVFVGISEEGYLLLQSDREIITVSSGSIVIVDEKGI